MIRCLWLLMFLVLFPWLAHAQPLPTLDPRAFFWTIWDFQEQPPGTAVFVLDGNAQGDLLAESGRTAVFTHGTTAIPLACADGSWFTGGSINSLGWVVGGCVTNGMQEAVILTADGSGGYRTVRTMAVAQMPVTGTGINDHGHVVGYLFNATGGPHAWWAGGLAVPWGGIVVPITITLPGQDIVAEVLTGVNNFWWASGYYTAMEATEEGRRPRTHGVVGHLSGLWQTWDAPGATTTFLFDVQDNLRAVGVISDAQHAAHSVLADPWSQQWYTIPPPNPAFLFTDVSGLLPQEPLGFVGRLIMRHPTDPNTNKVFGFRAVLKPSGWDAPPAPQTTPAAFPALAGAFTPQGVSAEQRSALLPTAAPIPRAPVRLNTETCDEGPGVIVPLRLRQVLGCP